MYLTNHPAMACPVVRVTGGGWRQQAQSYIGSNRISPSMQLSFPEQFVRKPDTEYSGCSTRRNWSLSHEYGAPATVGGVYVLCRLPVEDILQAENINIPVNHVTVYSE